MRPLIFWLGAGVLLSGAAPRCAAQEPSYRGRPLVEWHIRQCGDLVGRMTPPVARVLGQHAECPPCLLSRCRLLSLKES
jgi:hypothetical protein